MRVPGVLADDEVSCGEDPGVALPHEDELSEVGHAARQHQRLAQLRTEELRDEDESNIFLVFQSRSEMML